MPKKKKSDPLEKSDEIESLVNEIKHKKELKDEEEKSFEDFGYKDEEEEEVDQEQHHAHETAHTPDEEE